jgi:uncharacterized RDD family membrane protein YckC
MTPSKTQLLIKPANYWLRLVVRLSDFGIYLFINVFIISIISILLTSGLGISIDQTQEYFQTCFSDISSPQCLNLGANYRVLLWSFPIISTLIYIIYFVFFPRFFYRATPAKLLFKLKIISQEANPLSLLQLLVREIFFILFVFFSFSPFIPALSQAAGLMQIFIFIESSKALFSQSQTTWHDDLSSTQVIRIQKLDKNENFI